MTKRYIEGRWVKRECQLGVSRIEPGQYDDGEMLRFDAFIPGTEIPSLIEALDGAGYIKPRLDERLRTEDLKITHRLLDIIQETAHASDIIK